MKTLQTIGCILMSLMGSGQLMAGSEQKEYRVVSLFELNEKTLEQFVQGKMEDYAVECPKGAILPLTVRVKGEFLALDSTGALPVPLQILKTCYVRHEENQFLFSTDLHEWKGASEFFTGELITSIKPQEGELIAGVELDLNERKPS